jgi:hypothetical protein
MTCPICLSLERAYEMAFSNYVEARSSASFSMCPKVAAHKNVEMERTKYELEEHRLVCVLVSRKVAPPARAKQVYELETLVA